MLIEKKNVKTFWVGNYGSFDGYAASVVKELQEKYSDIKLELVIPYLTKEINENKYFYYQKYDSILMADIPESVPARYKIIKTNYYMIDNSAYMVCYVNRSWGGAGKALEYAKKKKDIEIFNLADK